MAGKGWVGHSKYWGVELQAVGGEEVGIST